MDSTNKWIDPRTSDHNGGRRQELHCPEQRADEGLCRRLVIVDADEVSEIAIGREIGCYGPTTPGRLDIAGSLSRSVHGRVDGRR
jgi:hypothetical protein